MFPEFRRRLTSQKGTSYQPMSVRCKIAFVISLFIALFSAPLLSAEKPDSGFDLKADGKGNSIQTHGEVLIAQAERILRTPAVRKPQDIQKVPPDQLEKLQPETDERGTVRLNLILASEPPLHVGEPISFEAEINPSYPNLQYEFNFGDGDQFELSGSSKVTHIYRKAGTYTVRVWAATKTRAMAARPPSRSAIEGTPIEIEVLNPLQQLELHLQSDREKACPGEWVRFQAIIEPSARSIRYQCSFGDGNSSEWTGRSEFEHRYEKEGTYLAMVEAVTQNLRLTSNRVRVTVQRCVPRPTARIYPEHIVVTRGEHATFQSHSEIHTEEGGRQYWQGPGGQKGEGKSFSVDTADLAPGEHGIRLDVSDTLRQRDTAVATLEVILPVDYQVKIATDSPRIKKRDRVTLWAHIVPNVEGVEYRYHYGDGSESGWTDQVVNEYAYIEEGEYDVLAEARIEDRTFRSESIRIVVEGRAEPVARIEPLFVEIQRGERAVFISTSVGDEIIRESWEGPGGAAGDGDRFEVATNDLEPREYEVHLEIEDKWKQRDMVTAMLEVVEPSAPEGSYVLNLEADPDQIGPRQPVLFIADLRPLAEGTLYKFHFGDGQLRELDATNRAEHVYSEPGVYYARVSARLHGRETSGINSRRIPITVARSTGFSQWDSLKWVALVAGALLLGGGAYYLSRRSTRKELGKNFEPRLQIRYRKDRGVQKIEAEKMIRHSIIIRLRPALDRGLQEINVEGSLIHKDGREDE